MLTLPPETDWELNLNDCLPPEERRRGKTLANTPSIDHQMLDVVNEAWTTGFTVSSNFARTKAALVAMAASLQLITTRLTSKEFGQTWQVTAKGLRWLNETRETE